MVAQFDSRAAPPTPSVGHAPTLLQDSSPDGAQASQRTISSTQSFKARARSSSPSPVRSQPRSKSRSLIRGPTQCWGMETPKSQPRTEAVTTPPAADRQKKRGKEAEESALGSSPSLVQPAAKKKVVGEAEGQLRRSRRGAQFLPENGGINAPDGPYWKTGGGQKKFRPARFSGKGNFVLR